LALQQKAPTGSGLFYGRSLQIDASVGAAEQREAAISVCLTRRHRSLALLGGSYMEFIRATA
jgi:hypothetical protein